MARPPVTRRVPLSLEVSPSDSEPIDFSQRRQNHSDEAFVCSANERPHQPNANKRNVIINFNNLRCLAARPLTDVLRAFRSSSHCWRVVAEHSTTARAFRIDENICICHSIFSCGDESKRRQRNGCQCGEMSSQDAAGLLSKRTPRLI